MARVIGKSPPKWPRPRRKVGRNAKGGRRSLNSEVWVSLWAKAYSSSEGLPSPEQHRQVRAELESLGRLTLIRSFSFCHFSASSSTSMIFSCSCSFCSDSSVCREKHRGQSCQDQRGAGETEPETQRPRLVIRHRENSGTFHIHPYSPSLGNVSSTILLC